MHFHICDLIWKPFKKKPWLYLFYLLKNPEDNNNRLKRWIMIGDHHQLPPVIKNMAFQKFCNMEQSLFTRLVRLGVPTVDLDAQGRARPGYEILLDGLIHIYGN